MLLLGVGFAFLRKSCGFSFTGVILGVILLASARPARAAEIPNLEHRFADAVLLIMKVEGFKPQAYADCKGTEASEADCRVSIGYGTKALTMRITKDDAVMEVMNRVYDDLAWLLSQESARIVLEERPELIAPLLSRVYNSGRARLKRQVLWFMIERNAAISDLCMEWVRVPNGKNRKGAFNRAVIESDTLWRDAQMARMY